jgi:ABC-type transport system substrate-binding protein
MRPRSSASRPFVTRRAALAVLAAALATLSTLALAGCAAEKSAPKVRVTWVAGRLEPAFDPDGPLDPTRAALERLLSRGLLEQDSSGHIRYAAAERFSLSADRLTLTFTLRPDLAYVDGTPCTSRDFALALEAGLARRDHGSRRWLLQAVRGVDAVRLGRPLPPLGIATPTPHTLVLKLARPDPLLPRKLTLPGVATAWKDRSPRLAWGDARGLGPYRVARDESGRRLVLTHAARGVMARLLAGPDSIDVRFLIGTPRVRTALRQAQADLVWPLPPGLLSEPLWPGYRVDERDASPARRLLLVFRADVPPLTKVPARHALAHALNRSDLVEALGRGAVPSEPWLDGAPAFEYPRLDASEVSDWLARGDLGRSFHVTLAYDADGAGAELARSLQGSWSRLNLYAELKPLRGEAALNEALGGQSQALLVESQPLMPGAAAELASLVMPIRGPAVGSFRTGWRTREFDPWISGLASAGPLDAGAAQGRLQEELVALPLLRLPWRWVARGAATAPGFDPKFGPELAHWVATQPQTR